MRRPPPIASVVAACAALSGAGCGESSHVEDDAHGDVVVGNDGARREVLAAIGANVVAPLLEAFEARARTLDAALTALATAEAAGESAAGAELDAARAAWHAAMDTWQEAELFQLGPAAAMGTSPGGVDLRDRIYSWPIVNPCRVDQETVKGLSDPAALTDAPFNVRGLAALEVLLFDPDRDNACPPQSTINTDGSWAALRDEDIRRRRAEYGVAVAGDLLASARALVAAWSPSGGDFLGELREAGQRDVYPSAQAGLNALSDALFYLEKEVKDMKVAMPLGLRECATDVCPQLVESRFAARSARNVLHNARAFQRGFLGGEPGGVELGVDDLLTAVGASDVASDMATKIAAAIVAIEAMTDPLEELLVTDEARVQAAYDAVKAVTDLLRTDVVTVLDLELPERVEGDND
ncbi:MAG: imelysin family protein [Deltaproteobacteria bacterium]|nr:imelysin family protein [Deltaproteobacteria bacterium]